jgi:hypothetical protein
MHAPTTTAATSPADHKFFPPTATELMNDTGPGPDYGTRPDRVPALTPTRRAPCPTL